MPSLKDRVKQQIRTDIEPLQVKVVFDKKFQFTAGPNRGDISIGIWVDDSHLPEDKRLPVNTAVLKQHPTYRNVIFRSEELMDEVFLTANDEAGTIYLPGTLKANALGAYWLNTVPLELEQYKKQPAPASPAPAQ